MISPIGAHVAAVRACTAAVGTCIIRGRGLARPPYPAFVTYITETDKETSTTGFDFKKYYNLQPTANCSGDIYSLQILQW